MKPTMTQKPPAPAFRIGVISDTHGLFDERITELFAGVDHILHAGDVGRYAVLDELRAIAPVTAVMGNVDSPEMGWRLTEFVELAGRATWCITSSIPSVQAIRSRRASPSKSRRRSSLATRTSLSPR